MRQRYICPKCLGKLSYKKINVSPGYFAACLNCDEDFYKMELNKYKNKKDYKNK